MAPPFPTLPPSTLPPLGIDTEEDSMDCVVILPPACREMAPPFSELPSLELEME